MRNRVLGYLALYFLPAMNAAQTARVGGRITDTQGGSLPGVTTGEEPHLLFGHTLEISSVAVSPDGKWIASGSQDGTIRLWPTPEGQPFHTLPYQEILQKIRALTNLRVVRDDASEGGHRIEIGPFPGWRTPPSW